MHRSGTSLLSSVLQSLGVSLPGPLITADEHNLAGYYEWAEVVALQERLLIDLDRWWPSGKGWLPLPEGWLHHPATRKARERLLALLRSQIQAQQGPWAIKDPRSSRLLPLWLDLAAELGVPLRLLLAVRDPSEVVRSLLTRDAAITGMTAARAQQLWWCHNLEVMHALPAAVPLAVVDFGRWFSHPEQQLRELLDTCPELQPGADQQREALALIDPGHRRSLQARVPVDRQLLALHQRLQCRPLARRWPMPQPPRRLRQAAPREPKPTDLLADPASWSTWLQHWQHHPAPQLATEPPLAALLRLCVHGGSWTHWQLHLWLQRLPLPSLGQRPLLEAEPDALTLGADPAAAETVDGGTTIALNLALPLPEQAHDWWQRLRQQQLIWDPEPARVWLLRALGLPAFWLDPAGPANGWLRPSDHDQELWGACYGLPLPEPCRCLCLGAGGEAWEHALADWECQGNRPVLQYLPQLPHSSESNVGSARLLASWLAAAAAQSDHVAALADPGFSHDPAMVALLGRQLRRFAVPITPRELLDELQGRPIATASDRPSPVVDCLLEFGGEAEAAAAVVISLYNYGNRIEAALASVAAQTPPGQHLELVVVDDASSDDGPSVARAWMDHHSSRFCCARLLRHRTNAGLAASRNTAFAHCRAPWVFVLDADNELFPQAVHACLAQAQAAGPRVAVVHPLVEVVGEGRHGHDGRSLISRVSWQRQVFLHGNVIDAMALVRRSAWQAVGGYTHIEGGWEDFDFWCKLMDADWHGLLCPRVLARYHCHGDSMTARSTVSNWRPLSRCLQQRHPWLTLPYAP